MKIRNISYTGLFASLPKAKKVMIYKVVGIGALMFLLIIFGLVVFNRNDADDKHKEGVFQKQFIVNENFYTLEDINNYSEDEIIDILDIPEEKTSNKGKGLDLPDTNPLDALNPFSSFQESVSDAFAEIIQQGLELFDDYVAFTPNVAKGDGEIVDARGNQITLKINKFYSASRTISFLLLPIVIVVTGITIVIEGRIKGIQVLMATVKKLLLFIIALASYRYIFALAIDLNNAMARYVLQTLVATSNSGTLSESLLAALGMNLTDGKLQFSLEGTLNSFGEIILWVALFFLLVTLLFQFIIRFFHLLIHLIVFPIILIITLLPGGGQFFRTYTEEVLRTIYMQPIFLMGIGIALEVISSVDEPIPKIILGLGALSFLNIIPAIVNKFSGVMWGVGGAVAGGLFAASTIGSAKKLKQGITNVTSGGRNNSLKSFASGAIGGKFASNVPTGTSRNKLTAIVGGKTTPTNLLQNQQKPGAFKQALKNGKAESAFRTLGMKPLANDSLIKGEKKDLTKINPDFSQISKSSLKDSEALSSRFSNSNYDSFMGDYPLVEGNPSFGQITNLSDFKSVNPQTHQLLDSVLNTQPANVNLGNTFDTSDHDHWAHLTEWYAKNESKTNSKPIGKYQSYIQDPANKMNIIRRASSEGYFKSQGINTVKTMDKISGQKPVTKYYQIKKLKK